MRAYGGRMTEHVISAAEAIIQGLTEQLAQACRERDQYKRERDEARAILAQHRLDTADEATEPEGDREAVE